MRSVIVFALIVLNMAAGSAVCQGGGKAEPNRIVFAPGTASKTVSGMLSNGQEMEYVFGAVRGQTVTIKNSNKNLFDFRVFSDEHGLETEFESSPTLKLEIPETGDYMFFIRKKQVTSPRRARFSLVLTIK